jgi:hypothetical protein
MWCCFVNWLSLQTEMKKLRQELEDERQRANQHEERAAARHKHPATPANPKTPVQVTPGFAFVFLQIGHIHHSFNFA